MRPRSIVWFERLFLASAALGLVNTALLSDSILAIDAPLSGPVRDVVVALGVALGVGIMLALWWFAARRASAVAKWLSVAVAAYTLFSLASAFARGVPIGGPVGVSVVVAGVLQIAAVSFLFRPDARAWFASQGELVA